VLGAGLYAPQLRHWLRLFPANRFLVLEESELREHPADVAERLTRFLALPQPITSERLSAIVNGSRYARPTLGDSMRRALSAFYAPHAPELRALWRELEGGAGHWSGARWLQPIAASVATKVAAQRRARVDTA